MPEADLERIISEADDFLEAWHQHIELSALHGYPAPANRFLLKIAWSCLS